MKPTRRNLIQSVPAVSSFGLFAASAPGPAAASVLRGAAGGDGPSGSANTTASQSNGSAGRTKALAANYAQEMVALRRELHQNPEVGLNLPQTRRRVLAALEPLGLEIRTSNETSSFTAVLRGRGTPVGERQVVLLRADMDALPITELVDVPYKSTNGAMHACGHDLHTAWLVGVAKILSDLRGELAGDVVFMFQAGEESLGGARLMVEDGLLDVAGSRVNAAFGLHALTTVAPRGVVTGKPQTILSGSAILRAKFTGLGGHGATPYLSIDPIPPLSTGILALQSMVTRRFNIFDPVVVTVGQVRAGSAPNVIPDSAEFAATVRTFSAENRQKIEELSVPLLQKIAEANGLTSEVTFTPGYPETVNNATEFALVQTVAGELLGSDRFTLLQNPLANSDDVAYVLQQVPGAFVFMGASTSDDPSTAEPNHSPRAEFDDSVLPDAAALLAELAFRRAA